MHGSRITHEVETCPREACEKVHGEQISFEPVTAGAGRNQVSRRVRPTVTDGEHVIQRSGIERERPGAVHTAPTAVAHGGFLYCSLGCDVAMMGAGWTGVRG